MQLARNISNNQFLGPAEAITAHSQITFSPLTITSAGSIEQASTSARAPSRTHKTSRIQHGSGTTTTAARPIGSVSSASARIHCPLPISLAKANSSPANSSPATQPIPLPPRLLHGQVAPAAISSPVGPTVESCCAWICLSGGAEGVGEGGLSALMRGRRVV